MVKPKKPAAKKGKYFDIFSQATQPLKIKPVRTCRLAYYLQIHSFDLLGILLSLSAYGAEVQQPFRKLVNKKSLVRRFSLTSESANLKKFQVDVDDLTDIILSLQFQLRNQQRRSPRLRLHQRNLLLRSQLRSCLLYTSPSPRDS